MRSLNSAAGAVVFLTLFFALQGVFDYADRTWAERAKYQRWVRDSCLPQSPGQRSVAQLDGNGKLDCTILAGGNGHGATLTVSSATMEMP